MVKKQQKLIVGRIEKSQWLVYKTQNIYFLICDLQVRYGSCWKKLCRSFFVVNFNANVSMCASGTNVISKRGFRWIVLLLVWIFNLKFTFVILWFIKLKTLKLQTKWWSVPWGERRNWKDWRFGSFHSQRILFLQGNWREDDSCWLCFRCERLPSKSQVRKLE